MDIARSSLEFPPPTWSRDAAQAAGRYAVLESNAAAAWTLVTCALIGLLLVIGIHPPLQSAMGVAVVLLALAGWSVLTVRMVRLLRQQDR